jgi:hypothetical protein
MWWGTRWRRWSRGLGQGSRGAGRESVGVEHGRWQWKPPRSSMQNAGAGPVVPGRRRISSSGRCGHRGVAESRDDGPCKTPCWRRVSVTDFPNPAPPRHLQQQLDLRLGGSPMATHGDAGGIRIINRSNPHVRPRSAFPACDHGGRGNCNAGTLPRMRHPVARQ